MSRENGIWYYIDTGWGCGAIIVKRGIVVDSAPIFRKLRGKRISYLKRIYPCVKLKEKEK